MDAGTGSVPDMKLLRDEEYAVYGLNADGIPKEKNGRVWPFRITK
jgi:hypothetical protein